MSIKFTPARSAEGEVIFIETDENTEDVRSVICGDKIFPAQKKDNGIIAVADTKKGTEAEFTLSGKEVNGGVQIRDMKEEKALGIYIDGELFTKYVYDEKYPKPSLGPVYTSDGTTYTRPDMNHPEHPHQRSVFIGVGDVNGIDFWNERPESMGFVRHKYFEKIENGSAYGSFTAKNIWQDMKNRPVLDEERTFTFYNQNKKCRYIDVEITFRASYKDVNFGPTKEAGPLGVRVNDSMRADRQGSFSNSYGGENEKECWGRAASWCDYRGLIEGRPCGIAIFDNEENERYPTAWHIRNYGLFAANNLYFKGGLTIPKAYSLKYKYRIVFYEGEENTADRFINYCN